MDTQAKSASALRRAVRRERGICRACGLIARRSRDAWRGRRAAADGAGGQTRIRRARRQSPWNSSCAPREGHAWHFDHVVAVKDGGACTVRTARHCACCATRNERRSRRDGGRRNARQASRHEEDERAKDEPVLSDRPVLSDVPSANVLAKDRFADGERFSTVPPVESIIDEDDEVISETESLGEARDDAREDPNKGHKRDFSAARRSSRTRTKTRATSRNRVSRDGRVSPLGRRRFARSHGRGVR